MADNISKKVNRATVWSSITELIAKIVPPIVNMILARLLSTSAFGLVATITVVTSFADVFTDAGFQKYIIQREFENDEELDRSTTVAFWSNLSLSTFVVLIIAIFRNQIACFVGSPGLGLGISVASVSILATAFSSIQMARYKRDFDFKTLFFVRMGATLIPLVITVPLAVVLKSYWALVIGNLSVAFFNAIVLTIKSKWKPNFFYSFDLFKQMVSFSFWSLLESISVWFTSYIGVFIVGRYLTDHYLGLYNTSLSTVNSYMAIITSAITPVLFSALSRYQNDEKMFKDTFYKFQRLTAVLIIPMGVGIFVFSDLVTIILLGEKWLEASGFIGLWGLMSAVFIVLCMYNSDVYRGKGKPRISLVFQVLNLFILIPTLLISIQYGFETLYIVRSLTKIPSIILGFVFMQVVFKFKWFLSIKNIAPSMFCACVMGVIGFLLKQLSDNVVYHFLVIAFCVVIYFGLLFVLFKDLRREIFSIPQIHSLLKKIKLINN